MFKKGILSWLKGKPKQDQQQQEARQAEQERIKAEQAEQERIKAEQAEQERIKAEQAEQERIKTEQAEQERIKAEQAEQERIKAEQAEQERIKAEQAEQERIKAEQAEQERIKTEQAEQERIKTEQAEQKRIAAEQAEQERIKAEEEEVVAPKKSVFFKRLKQGLKRTSTQLGDGFLNLFTGKKIDEDLFDDIEEHLLIADVGIETTDKLMRNLVDQSSRRELKEADALMQILQEHMQKLLHDVESPLVIQKQEGPMVILMVGVNGVGKTTTIGKLAKQYQQQGHSVMLAAGDTFRAAAVEQLQVWGERNKIPVVAQQTGSDSASVIYDAFESAKARGIDILIADTAGRLQNKAHLMEELKKIVRVMKKIDPKAPHEIMLTLDAGTGQNAISQAQLFHEAVGLTGITLSKLDGTAKGGVIFSIADQFKLPIRYIGVGEQLDDLQTFHAESFIKALFHQK